MTHLPAWIYDNLDKPARIAPGGIGIAGAATAYGEAALDDECRKVATALVGTRNDTLNRAAFAVAQLVAGGELDEATARRRLEGAAIACGLDAREIAATLDSGFSGGAESPRTAPERDKRPARRKAESGKSFPTLRADGFTAAALKRMEFPAIRYIVPGYIAEGLTLLAGRPKIGKSWLCLDIGAAVAFGGVAFGSIECEAGDVLYAALEDNPRRLQSRMHRIMPFQEWPERLTFWTTCPRLDDGGLEAIREWIEAADNPRLVIIDTLAKVRRSRSDKDSAYEADYRALEELHALAAEKGLAIVLIHHVRKMDAEDPLDTVSGTTGLTGAADTVLVLNRTAQGVTLYGRGRDIEEIESAVTFDKDICRWTILGEASEVHRSDERKAILDALEDGDLTVSDLAAATGMPRNNLDQLLFKMVKADEVRKVRRGVYGLPATSITADDYRRAAEGE